MLNLHIITRCSRTKNLSILFKSIFKEQSFFKITWHIGFDYERCDFKIPDDLYGNSNIVFSIFDTNKLDIGHQWINKIASKIKDEFIYILDDDNIIHENFYEVLYNAINDNPTKDYFVFNQYIGGKDFTRLDVRNALPKEMKTGHIDMAQMVLKNPPLNFLIKDNYCADGMFLEKEFKEQPEKFFFIEQILCYYNYITFWIDNEETTT